MRLALGLGVMAVLVVLATGGYGLYVVMSGPSVPPNVVLIVLDTARVDRFSFMGYAKPTSPNIDHIAAEGVVYDRAYATCFWTLTSHASLFTGRTPGAAGATSETLTMPERNVMMAELLKAGGYDTFGASSNGWIARKFGFAQGFDTYIEGWTAEARSTGEVPEQVALDATLKWLGERKPDSPPFFVFVNFTYPHLPYTPEKPFLEQFTSPGRSEADIKRLAGIRNQWGHQTGDDRLDEDALALLSELYDGEIATSDRSTGVIVDRLRAMGILDNTVLIITSDHGENLGEHGRIGHAISMHETTLHVPLVIRYPSRCEPGRRVSDLVSLVDLLPTVLDLCGLPPHEADDDWTAALSLFDDHREPRPYVMAENDRPVQPLRNLERNHPDYDRSQIDFSMRAMCSTRFKSILEVGRRQQLFDLFNDPGEEHDVADQHARLLDDMSLGMRQSLRSGTDAAEMPDMDTFDDEAVERLKTLGYF